MGYIRDFRVFENYLGEIRGKIGECIIVFVIVIKMLFLFLYWCSLKYVNYNNNNIVNFYCISIIKFFKVFLWIK